MRSLVLDARGTTLVEYVIVVGCVGVVSLGATQYFGGRLSRTATAHADCVGRLSSCEAEASDAVPRRPGSSLPGPAGMGDPLARSSNASRAADAAARALAAIQTPEPSRAGEWTETERRILQRRLLADGTYHGPVDGKASADLERALDASFRGPEWREMNVPQILGGLGSTGGTSPNGLRARLDANADFMREYLVARSTGVLVEPASTPRTGAPVLPRVDAAALRAMSENELLERFHAIRGNADRRLFLASAAEALRDGPAARSFGAALPVPWQIQYNLFQSGLSPDASATGRPQTEVANHSSPFSGVGATGVNATRMTLGAASTVGVVTVGGGLGYYKNPLHDMARYLGTLSAEDAAAQVHVLLEQPVSTLYPEAYAGSLPSRGDVIRLAAEKYRLEPELVAAVILAEQRDQSRNEDAAEFLGAIAPAGSHTSVGLGQVLTSNVAHANDLVNDAGEADRARAAHLLASDEVNIFATASMIRSIADKGAGAAANGHGSLPKTSKEYPGFDPAAYGKHSSQWPADNIPVLGSEYTTRPWDDKLNPWGGFVGDAYKTVRGAKVF